MHAATLAAQTSGPAMTQVVDTVYRADGTTAKGTVLISWPAFTTADGKAVAAGSLSVQLGKRRNIRGEPGAEHRGAAGGRVLQSGLSTARTGTFD